VAGQGPGIVFNGVDTRSSDIVIAPPGQDFCYRLSGSSDWGGMSIKDDDLAEISAAISGRDLMLPLNASSVTPPSPAMAKLLRLHTAAGYLARDAPEVIAVSAAARGLEQAIVETLIECITAPASEHGKAPLHSHRKIMTRFHTALRERKGEPVYIPQICAAIGVPARTLQLCCQEYLGMSPKKYLTQRRLHLAHRALRRSDVADTTVTEIATQFGFWELGRFAVAYKALFGESPSATLRYPVP
jgi:AraC-like DNA-binding protein